MTICSTCNVEVSPQDRTNHVRSDWHVYNLKRVVASLPPIPEDIFLLKKQAFCEPAPQAEKVCLSSSLIILFQKTYCDACKTLFHNNRSFDAHLKSKKHLRNSELLQRNGSKVVAVASGPGANDVPQEELSDSEGQMTQPQALALGSCLFCDKFFPRRSVSGSSDEDNRSLATRVLGHMLDAHNFIVPHPEKLVDPAGLLQELGRIVGEERACIYCGRQFYGRKGDTSLNSDTRVALKAVRNHMLDKPGHIQLWCGESDPVQVALLIAESEEQNSEVPPSAALAGGELFSRFYDQSIVAPTFLLPDAEQDVYEVRLPSGTVLGHRSMRTVYRQHLSTPATDVTQINRYALNSSNQTSSAVSTSHIGPLVVASRSQLTTVERVSDRHSAEARKAWELATGMQGNLVNRSRLRRQY
ncbi:unnamed protein product [Echinostoma caproni]|uniref:C2H2-type domain-containing protein n=1 Tax=Echinostoma caproni TaxID=27848 RepID=A0A183AK22_9TREM|nr:unnamed protein product [Echinostoma caproni]